MKGTKIKKDFDRSFALFFVPFVLLVVIIDPSASGIGIRIAEPKGFGNPFICRLDNLVLTIYNFSNKSNLLYAHKINRLSPLPAEGPRETGLARWPVKKYHESVSLFGLNPPEADPTGQPKRMKPIFWINSRKHLNLNR